MTNILEVGLLKGLMSRRNWDVLRPVVTQDMFDTTASRRLYDIIARMHETATDDLTETSVLLTVHATIKTQTDFRDNIIDIINNMAEIDDIDQHTMSMVVNKFCARALSMKAVEYVAAHIDSDSYDPSIPAGMLERAHDVSAHVDEDDLVDYAADLPPDQNVRTGAIGLGFSKTFDEYLDGGYAPGELAIFCSISGVGKTSMLLLAAAHAAKLGKNVLYISREINKHKCVARLDQCYTKLDKFDLVTHAQAVMNRRAKVPGKIYIKDWSHRDATVADIRALVLKMASKGRPIDTLVVDYMELISPPAVNVAHPRLNHTAVAVGMRALGAELGVRVLTAWQAKRAAFNKMYLEKDDLGEDWNVVKTADIIVGLNQNSEENTAKIIRVNVIKQRESTNRRVMTLHADLDRMIVREATLDEEEDEEVLYGADKDNTEDGVEDAERQPLDPEGRARSDFA